jgi:hypothetical protein
MILRKIEKSFCIGIDNQNASNDEKIANNPNIRTGCNNVWMFVVLLDKEKTVMINNTNKNKMEGAATISEPSSLLAKGRLVKGKRKTSKYQNE